MGIPSCGGFDVTPVAGLDLEAFANVLGVRVSALFRDVDPNAGAPAKLKAGRKPGTSN
ncbi:MAG: hypothetical protein J0H80_05040 [Rhizobiales bacterium]|nr:hypothetical protein [Hyphomicrobiales bacterium]